VRVHTCILHPDSQSEVSSVGVELLTINLTVGYILPVGTASKAAQELARLSVAARRRKWGREGFRARMRAWGKLGGRPPKKGNDNGS